MVPREPSPDSRPSLHLGAMWALSTLSQDSHERLGPMFIEHLLHAVPKGSIAIFISLNYRSSERLGPSQGSLSQNPNPYLKPGSWQQLRSSF